jgi:hypothetical protein
MNEAKWTPMVVVRAHKDPAVIAMKCRANRGTNDSVLYLEKPRLEGVKKENADLARLAVSR